ncbi:hypothetical protein [Chengkuizengella sediminis]|uniref:hypothetical protein n=1 Tax=Chengkuizengella sediminis TaxID=1885917 RepID=UPI00138A1704|nr:hypothetical protein [Chengkuizengella sediminis]NDI35734.1 hypothetical protein [Chengkuizengella sediminis]
MNNLFDKVFSVNEMKLSVLVIIFFISSVFALTMYVTGKGITDNLLTFLITLICAITGINAMNMTKDSITIFKEKAKNTKAE